MAGKSNFGDAIKRKLLPQVRQLGAAGPLTVSPIAAMSAPQALTLGMGEILATGGSQVVEDITQAYWFSALPPVTPMAPSSYRPRQRAFLPGENILWTPGEDKGGIDYDILRALVDSWDLLRLVIETRKDQLARVAWEIRPKMKPGMTKADIEEQKLDDKQLDALNTFFERPDGVHRYRPWLRMWSEDMLVLDATSLYLERDTSGKIASVHPLDGATISRNITDQGFVPQPPSPAYQQVVYGTPACNLTTDDLIYAMRNERTHKRYGYPATEQILISIGIGLKRQEFISKYYSDGNIPEALCFLPSNLSPDRIKQIQDWFDSVLAGDLAKRRRLTFLPGFGNGRNNARPNVVFSKEALLHDPLDEWLARIVCFAFSVSPQQLIKQMNRASAQQSSSVADEEGLEPALTFVADTNNEIISKLGMSDDYEFAHKAERETDPLKQAQIDNILVGKVYTINETRKKRGDDPYEDPNADKLGTFALTGFIPLDTPPPPPMGALGMGAGAPGQSGKPAPSKPAPGQAGKPNKPPASAAGQSTPAKPAPTKPTPSPSQNASKDTAKIVRDVRYVNSIPLGKFVHPVYGDLAMQKTFAAFNNQTGTLFLKGVDMASAVETLGLTT
jgi:hypothetical protein